MTFLGNLVFLNPWVLAGLVALPALWLLLRVTPPAPKRITFPAAHFLAGLQPDEQTPSKTPWWILLLRLVIAALILVALAQPILNPGETLPGSGPVRIIVDNGWEAAQGWETKTARAQAIIDRAGRESREILLMTTAPEPGKAEPFASPPLTSGQASAVLNGLSPHPWSADYEAAQKVAALSKAEDISSFFLSSGLQGEGSAPFIRQLQNQGRLDVTLPDQTALPLLLRAGAKGPANFEFRVSYPETIRKGTIVRMQAVAKDGRILDLQEAAIEKTRGDITLGFDLPDNLRQQVSQIRLAGRQGAGAMFLVDAQAMRRSVGLVTPAGKEDSAPFIEAGFYLNRALEPYADIHTGTVEELLSKEPAVIVLPDIGGLPPNELNALTEWVSEGGMLLRFAGPNMTTGDNFLTPVPLRKGGRALDGSMTWDKPLQMAPFPKTSPYFGLTLPEEGITVKRQLLPEAVTGLEDMTWAALTDGTPLITAASQDRGTLVLVHTTATPHWSDLSLSGLFVQLLRRTIALAGQPVSRSQDTSGVMQPLTVLDGLGRLAQPGAFVKPISGENFEATMPSSSHPPGIYGRAGYQKALNLGERLSSLEALSILPAGVSKSPYTGAAETNLMPWLLLAAFTLFLIDWLLMIVLQGNAFYLRFVPKTFAALLAAILILGLANPALAQTTNKSVAYAGDLHLAFIKSGSSQVDYTAMAGLETLAEVLTIRTSVEPAGVVALDPERDDLAFFPLIYWPVAPNQQPPSADALAKIQHYIDHGGTILIDTRSQSTSGQNSRDTTTLQNLLSGLNVPPLIPMPKDHVLTKSFYLLSSFPGRYDGGTLWIEENSANGRDGVSSIIIGNNDWAAAWATADTHSGFRLYGGQPKEEMALRAGINLMMYALTGNYKADQVHLPHILERLGQ